MLCVHCSSKQLKQLNARNISKVCARNQGGQAILAKFTNSSPNEAHWPYFVAPFNAPGAMQESVKETNVPISTVIK